MTRLEPQLEGEIFAHLVSQRPTAPLLKLYLSFRHRNETARKKRERKQSTTPFPIRRTKAEEACEKKDSLTERDDPRDRSGEREGVQKDRGLKRWSV